MYYITGKGDSESIAFRRPWVGAGVRAGGRVEWQRRRSSRSPLCLAQQAVHEGGGGGGGDGEQVVELARADAAIRGGRTQ